MKIKQIIVDVLPDNCRKCDLMVYDTSHQNYLCYVTKKKIYPSLMPTWCPLVIEEECVWKAEMEWTDRLSNEGFWHIDTKCDWTYPEDYDATIADLGLDTIEEFVKLMGFKYCPNCGKRIRYAESEE